jgi:hydrogenase maturation protease
VSRVLVAGVGNVFKGDDAFGVEVAQRLAQATLPAGVDVVDFGIRGIDLTYALLDDYDAAVLVDITQRGEPPGTVYVIEPEIEAHEDVAPEDLVLSPHDLDPAKVLVYVNALDGRCQRILVVGCEPEDFGGETEGKMGLSKPVAAAVEPAMALIESRLAAMVASRPRDQSPRHETVSDPRCERG